MTDSPNVDNIGLATGTHHIGSVSIDGYTSLDITSAISGQITVTTSGTAVQGTNIALDSGVYVKAMAANTGKIYVGNDGANSVSLLNGFELSAGETVAIQVDNLNKLWFNASVNGQKASWLKI